MGYLGKISAIVSANTADFSSKLAGASKDVQAWARSLDSAVRSASTKASTSLRNIYTEAQRAERALKAIQTKKINFTGFEGLDLKFAVERMRDLISVTKSINQPLAEAARSLEKLPISVQSAFLPAMVSAQSAAERLATTINETGTASEAEFSAVAEKVDLVTASMRRLQEATGMVSRLSRGDTLRFATPRQFDALNAAQQAQQATDRVPATILSRFGIGDQQAKVTEAANRVNDLLARRERRLSLGLSTNRVDAMLETETDRLEAQIRVLERRNDAAQKFALIVKGGFVSSEDLARTASRVPAATDESQQAARRAQAEVDFYATSKRLREQAAAESANLLARRAQGEREFYELLKRLQEQAAADEVTFLARRAQAGVDADETRTRLERQAAEDSALPLIRRSQAEVEAEQVRERLLRPVEGPLGPDLANPAQTGARRIDALIARVVDVKSQLDKLPQPLVDRFIPALQRAEDELARLRALPSATADEIARAEGAVRRLEAGARRASLAMDFRRNFGTASGINSGLQASALRGYTAQMQILQGAISRMAAEARGPAVQAAAALGAAISRHMRRGTMDTREARAEIERLRVAAAAAVSEGGGRGGSGLVRRMTQAGDVSRMGVDRWSLALQQAGFAIDDFMASTGGVDQKLRAVSNNISQMAFVIGGTRGLFIGLGVTLASQVAIGIYKWVNGGKTAEDMAKALNEVIGSQIEDVKKLADEYDRLGDSLLGDVFSEGTREAEKLRLELKKLADEQEKARNRRLLSTDIGFIEATTEKAKLEREVKDVSDVGTAAAMFDRIAELDAFIKRRERSVKPNADFNPLEAARGAVGGQTASTVTTLMDAAGAAPLALGRLFAGNTNQLAAGRDVAERLAGLGENDREGLRAIIRERMNAIGQTVRGGVGFGTAITGTSRAVSRLAAENARLQEILNFLDQPKDKARDKATTESFQVLARAGSRLAATFASLDEAGIRFSVIGDLAQKAKLQLEKLRDQRELETDPKKIAAIDANIRAVEAQTEGYRSAANAASIFTATLKRVSQDVSDAAAARAKSAAEKARDDANEAAAGLMLPAPFLDQGGQLVAGADRRRAAAAAAARQEQAAQDAKAAADAAAATRERNRQRDVSFRFDAAAGRFGDDAARLIKEREGAQREAEDQALTGETREAARRAVEALDQRLAEIYESTPAGRQARAEADADARAQRQREMQIEQDARIKEAAVRGRDAVAGEAGRAARDFVQRRFDLEQAAKEGLITNAQRDKATRDARREATERVGPALFSMMEEVQNSILSGPSRAALTASDASTVEGQRELNRLLRGDDSARDVNLVEMQKQTHELEKLNEQIRLHGVAVAAR